MVKVKNKKRTNADAISTKKEALRKKALNPFEVHINNEKIKVLGRKLKNDRGLPGVSRAKALAKRKHTLLPEYEMQNKSNQFHDRRIGERDTGLSAEDKSMARYTAVRVRQHSKKSIFNLADDEVLTHRGQTLSEIEKFDDPKSDDEDDVDESGKLDSQFVEEVHFGGGMLKKADGAKSHKDLIEQLIAESKKRKVEMQKQREATMELTEKLDSEWKDLLPLVSKKQKTDEVDVKVTVDDYDKVMRELKFEARGVPSDKLKTEDEIAREEKDKLERLERERLERMRGIIDTPKNQHRSADDLYDNFAYDDDDLEDVTLSYNQEGQSNVQLAININKEDANDDKQSDDDESSEGDDDVDDDDDEGNESGSDETEDDLSDLKASESESDEEEEVKPTSIQLTKKPTQNNDQSKATNGILKKPVEETPTPVDPESIKEDLIRRKEIMEKARKELPFTFALPENYESLRETLKGKSPEEQGVIIERMIKCNHPSLREGNKDALGMLLVYILQYFNDLCGEVEEPEGIREVFNVFGTIVPYLFDLAQLNPENAANSLLEVIKEKQGDFRGQRTYPGVDVLVYLKLIGCLFSTSDFRHYVVNPAVMFIEQLLTKSRVRGKADVAYGLFLVCLFLEYTTLSKRFLPSTIIFLNGLLHMAIPKTSVRIMKVVPPFKSQSSLLVMSEPMQAMDNHKMEVTDLFRESNSDTEIEDNFKRNTIMVTVSLLRKFYNNLQEQPSCCEIFEKSLEYLKMLPVTYYDPTLVDDIKNLIASLEELKKGRQLEYLQMAKQRPKALRLYEPNIVRVFDEKSHKVQSREKAERDKLLYKIKKEKKGALREIRRDKAFLGRVQLDRKLQSDAERKEKVKRIFSEAAMQQSELNALDRGNKRKKK